ncbi:MAG: hypothetical protein WCY38_01810, partial [Endomicrobiia bacterium]
GKIDIRDSKLESKGFGIKKIGIENLRCDNIKIYSKDVCFDISYSDMSIINNAILKSNMTYALIIKKVNTICLSYLKCIGNKGIYCNNTANIYIDNLKIDTISNSLKITDSNVAINSFDISSKIFQQSILVEGNSNFNLTNGLIHVCDDFRYVSDYPVIVFRNDSNILFNNVNIETTSTSNIKLITCKEKINFIAKNINVKTFNKFLDATANSCVAIIDSYIETNNDSMLFHGNSSVDIYNTTFVNNNSFKFLAHDFSLLKLEKVSVINGLLVSCDKYAQIYSIKSTFNVRDNAVRMSEYSLIYDFCSKWEVTSSKQNQYLFSLMDIAKLNIDKSEISINEQCVFAVDKSEINISNSSISNNSEHLLFDCRYNTKLKILNTNIVASFLLQLQDNSKAYIEKSDIYIRNLIAKNSDESSISISNTVMKSNNSNSVGFILFNYSKINVLNSIIDKFNKCIICNNLDNVNINDTKINCKNQFIQQDGVDIDNKIGSSKILYKLQLFVLSTRKIFVFNFIYRLIYLLSVKNYSILNINNKYILSIYLRRGMLNNDWIAGSSDIDYLTIIKDNNLYAEMQSVFNINNKYKKIKKILPFYGENLIMTNSELNFYLKYGGIRVNNLLDAKLLSGEKNINQKIVLYEHNKQKFKIDIVSEILNSYILFSNNYFCDSDIVTDICFSKAVIDILKYIDFSHTANKPINSRIEFLEYYLVNCYEDEKDILKYIVFVLKDNIILKTDVRNEIFNLIFKKLNDLSVEFNNFAKKTMNLKKMNKDKQIKTDNILFDEKIDNLQKEIPVSSIILDSPGICYVTIDDLDTAKFSQCSGSFMNFYKEIKKIKILYFTPVMFFTKNMFQMLLLAIFKNTPLNYLKLKNINNKYLNRIFYLKSNTEYYYHNYDTLKILILESVSDLSFHINDIDISKKFIDIKDKLFSLLIQVFGFNLYIKNAKIKDDSFVDNIIDSYKNYNRSKILEIDSMLLVFEDNCELSDLERIMKVISFIKKSKNEFIKDYLDEL